MSQLCKCRRCNMAERKLQLKAFVRCSFHLLQLNAFIHPNQLEIKRKTFTELGKLTENESF